MERLSLIPLPNIAVVFADVALCAGRDKVPPNGHPAVRLGDYVVKRDLVGLAPAIGASTIPGVDDLAPETALCGPLGDQL